MTILNKQEELPTIHRICNKGEIGKLLESSQNDQYGIKKDTFVQISGNGFNY